MEIRKVEERRSNPRLDAKVRVKWAEDDTVYVGNISKTGIFLETARPFAKVGTEVDLELKLPRSSEAVKVRGKVVRVTGPHRVSQAPGMGIHFLRIETRKARTFERLLDQLLKARGIGSRKYVKRKEERNESVSTTSR